MVDRGLAARITAFVALCLAGYAWLAFADGDPERAARLEGAAEGPRRRAGLRAWPTLRHNEDELVARSARRWAAARCAAEPELDLRYRSSHQAVRALPGTNSLARISAQSGGSARG
jgi:hypothetical protein